MLSDKNDKNMFFSEQPETELETFVVKLQKKFLFSFYGKSGAVWKFLGQPNALERRPSPSQFNYSLR